MARFSHIKFLKGFLLILMLLPATSFAQNDSIPVGADYRQFIVHLPTGYNSAFSYPLVYNYHGLNSTAQEQQLYTQFDNVADTAGFIVVYPQAVNNSWNLSASTSSPNDSLFTVVLLDTLLSRYNINSQRIYMCGMSMGGFLSYILACELDNTIAAIAVVGGNMATISKAYCNISRPMPVMHIHGTADYIVSYNGTFGITDVESTVEWWGQNNNDNLLPVISSVPDINLADSCNAEWYYYAPGPSSDSCEVVLIKINNGGHTWPGPIPVPVLGNTCQDFNASAVIWEFFSHHQLSQASSISEVDQELIILYPNPAFNTIYIKSKEMIRSGMLTDHYGKLLKAYEGSVDFIDLNGLPSGMYYLSLLTEDGYQHRKFLHFQW